MGLKIFGAGGIDQKSNNLLRDPQNLRDALNVKININNEFTKRPGTDVDSLLAGIYSSYPVLPGESGVVIKSDFNYLKSLDGYFYFDGVSYRFRKYTGQITVANLFIGIYPDAITLRPPFANISGAEYLNTYIFTHEQNQTSTMKFDGAAVYKAGLPTPKITTFSGSGSGFIFAFFDFIDMAGNTIYGPGTIIKSAGLTGTFNVDRLSPQGFYGDTFIATLPIGVTTLDANNRALGGVTGGVFTPGKKIMFRTKGSGSLQVDVSVPGTTNFDTDSYVALEVESFIGGVITFTADSFKGKTIQLKTISTGSYQITYSTRLRLFYSTSETTGYDEYKIPQLETYIDESLVPTTQAISFSFNTSTPELLLSDIYDITTSKLRPPKCQYITNYGYQIVCGNVISFWDFDNKETNYTNNDLVMYSDLSTGDLGENFSETNRQLIGDTFDGKVTGIVRAKDSLIAFKDRSVYSLDGILIPGQYTMRKIETNQIGCISDKSILSVDSTIIFQGQDGLYGIDGYTCKKITTDLDPFFNSLSDPTVTRSVMNNNDDQYIFWTKDGVVVFDYNYKKWLIWNAIDGTFGTTVDDDGSLRFFSGVSAKKFITAKNDSGVAINAYIDSAWFDAGEPSLLKKATDTRFFAFSNAGQTLQLTYFLDWSTAKFKGPFEIDFSDPLNKTIHKNLDIIQHQSFSFRIQNNVINEDLNLSGYDVSVTVIQTKDKNVK